MWKECIRKPLLVSSMCHNVCSSYLLAMLKPLSSQWICVCVWFYRQQHHELHCRQRKHPLAKLKGHFGWSLWDYLIGYTGLLFLFVILRFKWSYDWWRGLEVTWLCICFFICTALIGILHPKMKLLSSFTYPLAPLTSILLWKSMVPNNCLVPIVHQNIFLCVRQKKVTRWVNDDRIFIFGWSIPLRKNV